jgi:hypothetical protein
MTDVVSVGKTAGEVWEHLRGTGKSSVSAVEKAVAAPGREVHMAIGWLAREGQVELGEESRGLYVWLK